MKNYNRFVLNSMRPTIANTRQNALADFMNRICGAVAKLFYRSG